MAPSVLGVDRDYSSLSVKDLLEARDHYHWHLTHMANVIGTAVGLYYIRRNDPWPSRNDSYRAIKKRRSEQGPKPPRTFANSGIRDYSWPCVLVLVDEWLPPSDFGAGKRAAPTDMVPKTLFLPDGRTIPVCVVKVDRAEPEADLLPSWSWPRSRVGGGCPVISSTQGQDNVASVGSLVTDGHTVYALTSRHVAGPPGHAVDTILGGRRVHVGDSAAGQVTRRPFSEVYPEFPGRRSYLTVDAGLLQVENVDDWTSQVLGLPYVGELADLSERNTSTRLIEAEVTAYGAATGLLEGRIAALFYRHRSRGGYDDITDFLIAPLPQRRGSQPGDSGTVWHLVETDDQGRETLRPLALQWGGQRFRATAGDGGSGASHNFALAASMTTVLRLLDVELVVDHNTSAQPFWGKTGHYSIASLACTALRAGPLSTLMDANIDRISFDIGALDPRQVNDATIEAKKAGAFIPLADVPDLVWKATPDKVRGGRDTRARVGPEHPTHHADCDVPNQNGKTLRDLSLNDTAHVSVRFWQDFYTQVGHNASRDRGLLPFRVWQFFDEMTRAAVAGDARTFVCAAGLLAHYVGDACQVLHGSQYADGVKGETPIGEGVHSAYESAMIDHRAVELLAGIEQAISSHSVRRPRRIRTGQQAARAIIALMERSAERIDPLTLVKAYAETQRGSTAKNPTKNQTVTTALWEQFGAGTIDNMADGALTLAMLWESAWHLGAADQTVPAAELVGIDRDKLQALYEDPGFIESLDLDHIDAVLSGNFAAAQE